MSVQLVCCHGCNKWRKYEEDEEYFKCECGCETFTEEWLLKHPEHHAYERYMEFLRKETQNGETIEQSIERLR